MALPPTRTAGNPFDASGLSALKRAGHENSPEAIAAAATQFEALLLNMMLKSMREATPSEGLMESEDSKTLKGMLDQQWSQTLATRGIGLAAVLTRQLSAHAVNAASPAPAPLPEAVLDSAALKPALTPALSFSAQHAAAAEAASQSSGIPATFMLGQAALESGWGKREIRQADGSASHNLFGIKAGANWNGPVAQVVTTEYVDGVPQKSVQAFRAYDSYEEAFADYAALLTRSGRYKSALASATARDAAGFARGLQQAGYATDPTYAQKLVRVIGAMDQSGRPGVKANA